MELGLEGKVALVSGASAGLGRAVAAGLAREGARVVMSGRDQARLEVAAEAVREESGGEVLAIPADSTRPDELAYFVGAAVRAWGTVHILVNNVGGARRAAFLELDEAGWTEGLDLNLRSAMHCARLALPHMIRQQWGRIINLAALSAREPPAGQMASNVPKAGLLAFSKTLSLEVARWNVLVNCICPGRVWSAQIERAFTPEQAAAFAARRIPLGRFGRPEEVAALAVFLASERAGYVTGTCITVDGGLARSLY
ncbi:MAG: SDR family oxidoreductase [Deltaproteobacteria bacterium]|nr:SDR family oxidoreductase [Deltaproteobacteria bacterium]